MDDKVKVAVDHVKTHVTYPATTAQLMEACESWNDVDPELMEQAKQKMVGQEEKTWENAEEVLTALGWPTE